MENEEKKIPERNDTAGLGHGIVETYADDMAKVIEDDQGGGIIKNIIHGEEQHEVEKKNLSPESTKNRIFMIISLLLIGVGFVLLMFFASKKGATTVPLDVQYAPIIFNDKTFFLPIKGFTGDNIAQAVRNEVKTTKVKNGGVEGIYLSSDKKVVGFKDFMTLLKGNLVFGDSNFIEDNFLLGVVRNDIPNDVNPDMPSGRDFFMLVKVRSLADVFPVMRTWENKMFFDLHDFFGIPVNSETEYLLTKDFQDGIVENKNARVLYDKDNNIVMAYIFADDNSIIFTSSPKAAREIIWRLASSQIKK